MINLVTNNFYIDIEVIKTRVKQIKLERISYSEKYSQNSSNLKGLAVSSGVVRGKVRVVDSIDNLGQINENEILVTKSLDIGWAPVFPLVKGLITEIGGVLSHASIIARELGVPAIVNIEEATSLLVTGEEVVLDANSGIIIREL